MKKITGLWLVGLFALAVSSGCTSYRVQGGTGSGDDVYLAVFKDAQGSPGGFIARCKADADGSLKCTRAQVEIKK